MYLLSSLEKEMRGSRSNSDGSVGKLRADPALSGLGEGIVIDEIDVIKRWP
jgi:hypothetical protein